MLLKRLYENQDLLLERILIKEQKRLKLSNQELMVLLALFSMYKKPYFSLNAIAKKVDLSANEIGIVVDSLISKDFINIYLEQKETKQREVFSLDQVFFKLEALYIEDQRIADEAKFESKIGDAIKTFEQGMGKALSAYELETIRGWYADSGYNHDLIMGLVEQATLSNRLSVKYIERMLNKQLVKPAVIDDQADQVIDQLFKAMK